MSEDKFRVGWSTSIAAGTHRQVQLHAAKLLGAVELRSLRNYLKPQHAIALKSALGELGRGHSLATSTTNVAELKERATALLLDLNESVS